MRSGKEQPIGESSASPGKSALERRRKSGGNFFPRKMASETKGCIVEEELGMILESDDDGDSGANSFLTDDELTYQERLDPAEE